MLGDEIILESAVSDLAKKLPSLEKHDYNTIDKLMRKIASKHHITGKALHDLFIKKFDRTPDEWIKDKLDEDGEDGPDYIGGPLVPWISHLKSFPLIVFGRDHDGNKVKSTVKRFTKTGPESARVSFMMNNLPVHMDLPINDETIELDNFGHGELTLQSDGNDLTTQQAYNLFQYKTWKPDTTKVKWEPLDEDGEDQNWRDDPMLWHGSQNDEYEDWYEEQKYKPLRVKVHNISGMGFQPASGVYTVRNFKKI